MTQQIEGIKAVFTGDTNGLLQAFRKVEVSAAAMEKKTGAAFKGLDYSVRRFTDSIKGAGIAEKLQTIELSIQRMGGVANLTAPQLGRLRTEIDKLAAAGAKIPASLKLPELKAGGLGGLAGLDKAIQGAGAQQLQGLSSSLGTVGTALSAIGPAGLLAAAGIGAVGLVVGSTVKAAVDLGSRVTDLSAKTGLSTDAIQSFGYAAEQTGASMDDVARAALTMERNVAAGASVFKSLGLDISELRSLSPEDQFLAVAEAIRQIDDPAKQAQAAFQAFGKAGAELLPAIREGFAGLADQAKEFGLIVGKDAIAAGDRFGDSMDRASKAWENLKATVGGKIIGVLQLDVILNNLAKEVGQISQGELPFKRTGGGLLGLIDAFQGKSVGQDKAFAQAQKGLSRLQVPKIDLGLPGADEQLKLLSEGLPKALSKVNEEARKSAEAFKNLKEIWREADDGLEKLQRTAESTQLDKIFNKQAAGGIDKLLAATTSTGIPGAEFGSVKVDPSAMASVVARQEQLNKGASQEKENREKSAFAIQAEARYMEDLRQKGQELSQNILDMSNLFELMPGQVGQILVSITGLGSGLAKALNNLKGLGTIFGEGGKAKFSLGNLFKTEGKFDISKSIGSLGQIGAVIGSAIGIGKAIVGGFKKLFGGKSEAQKAAETAGKILGRTVSEEMGKEILARAKETGKSIEQVAKEMKLDELKGKLSDKKAQAATAVGQIGAGVGGFGKIKGAADAQGRIFGRQFAAVVQAEGFDKALEMFKATFDQLPEDIKAAIPKDIQQLFAFADNESFKGAIDGIAAMAEGFKGTVGLIGLSKETLADYGQVAQASFDQAKQGAIEAGATQEEAQRAALQAVIPLLSQMQSAAIAAGQALDPVTQGLIDAAKAAGIDIPVDPLIQVVDVLRDIKDLLMQLNGMEVTPRVRVETTTVPGGATPQPTRPPGGGKPGGFARGGIVNYPRMGRMAVLHGREAIIPLDRPADADRVTRKLVGMGIFQGFTSGGFTTGGSATASVVSSFGGPSDGVAAGGVKPGGGGVVFQPGAVVVGPFYIEGGDGEDLADKFRAEVPGLVAEVERMIDRRLATIS